ncbi:MAG: hypothetical protein ACWGPN_02700, partial [Gammaproteobacteria bacterium]
KRHFESLGPADSRRRSLRQLDLEGRLFRYPLSYLIYSEAVDALPDEARLALFARIRDVLDGEGAAEAKFAHLTASDRLAISEILRATKPEVLTP